jgi:sacsin
MEGEISFDQSERLTARLRDLVRNYPKGPGLVKEFLQNADDAGASKLHVILDRRTHDADNLPSNMRAAQGPALLFFNDRVFSEDDFNRIQRVGAGGKVEEAAGTGRFGHGFNTCYSVSDHPSLLTGDRVAWFDPHHHAACRSRPQNARAWVVRKSGRELLPWLRTFSACGWDESRSPFIGTIFRLPLRTANAAPTSEISNEAFADEDFEEIIRSLRDIGAPLLLFLRSVLELEIREIDPSGKDVIRLSIRTLNAKEVDSSREPVRSRVTGKPGELLRRWTESSDPLPVARFEHHFSIGDGPAGVREEKWAVVTGLFAGPENALLQAALRVTEAGEKAIPWAGAATRTGSSGGVASTGMACFLPLPGSTCWPVWIHGWFDLPSNRQGITRSRDAGSSNHARYDWNKLLMRYGAGQAWALLLEHVTGDPRTNSRPYQSWPGNHGDLDELDTALVEGFYHAASDLPVLRARVRDSWVWSKLDDGPCTLDDRWHEKLLTAFSTEGWRVCDPPVPPHIAAGLVAAGKPIPQLTPSAVRSHVSKAGAAVELPCRLDAAPLPMLRRREWVLSIAEFCAEGCASNLAGLPLALLVNQLLDRFGKEKRLYLAPKQAAVLLERLPQRRLAPALLEALAIKEAVPEIGVRRFDAGALLLTHAELQFSDPRKREWLAHAFKFLASCSAADVAAHAEQLKTVEWIPDQRGKWHTMGHRTTPLLAAQLDRNLRKVLFGLEVPLLTGISDLAAACAKFAEAHARFLRRLTPTDLVDILEAHVERPFLREPALDDQANLTAMLDYLSSDLWFQTIKPERKVLLRRLSILRTQSGARVSGETPQVFVPSGFQPPEGIGGTFQLLETGSADKWKPLLHALSIPELDGETFIRKVLLPVLSDPELDAERRFTFLEWLRDQHRAVASSLTKEKRAEVFKAIQAAEILPVTGGGLASPARTYAWDAKKAKDVLGILARTPDRKFFRKKQDLWEGFFAELELPSWPLPSDLLGAIKHLQSIAKQRGASAVQHEIEKVTLYLAENWSKLSGVVVEGDKTMAVCLSELAWLPAHRVRDKPFAACAKWEDRLWKPSDLLPRRLGHLVASKFPILGLKEDLCEEVWRGIRGKASYSVSELAEHFRLLTSLPLADGENSAAAQSAYAILRAIGSWSLDDPQHNAREAALRPLIGTACIPVGTRWYHPHKCYLDSFRPPASPLQSWTDSGQPRDPMLINGLRRLGVRTTPDVADWTQVIEELAKQHEGNSLPEADRKSVRKIYSALKSLPHQALASSNVRILLSDGRLFPVTKGFLPDDPRLKKSGNLSDIPLVEDVVETRNVAALAGATSISSVIKNRLSDSSRLRGNQDDQAKLDEIRATLRSSQFHAALRRLRYHEYLEADVEYQAARLAAESLDVNKVTALRLRAAEEIIVESVAFVEDREITVVESDRKSFHDLEVGQLFFAGGTPRSVKDNIAETISEILELKAQLKLRALLDVPVERLAEFLDEENIADPYRDEAVEVGEELEEEEAEWTQARRVDVDESAPESDVHPEEEDGARDGEVQRRSARPPSSSGRVRRPARARDANSPAPDRPGVSSAEYFDDEQRDEVEDFSESEDSDSSDGVSGSESRTDRRDPLTSLPPRRVAGVGGGTPALGVSTGGSHGKGRRPPGDVFRSMTQRDGSGEESPERAAQRKHVDALAVQLVVQELRAAGWGVQEMAHNNPGYDLEVWPPGGESSRCEYWEVKGLGGDWSGWAVTMSATQLDYNHMWAARKEGGRFSLVVVANVDSETPSIYRIRNPFEKIQGYFLDGDWSVLDEPFLPGGQTPPLRPRRT